MNQYQINRDALVRYINSQGWKYTVLSDDGNNYVVRAGFNIENRLKSINMFIGADSSCIQSIGVAPINADASEYNMVVEYLTRANYGLKVGNFEFDYDDGEVRFQSILTSISGLPDAQCIEVVVDMPFHMFKKYGDGLVKALMGFGNPKADIAAAEA